jgi:hypothetical protein
LFNSFVALSTLFDRAGGPQLKTPILPTVGFSSLKIFIFQIKIQMNEKSPEFVGILLKNLVGRNEFLIADH